VERRYCTAKVDDVHLEDWKQNGVYFDFKGHPIFTREGGAGEDLLLIHGFPTSSWDWNKMWPSLIRRYRVHTLDMIGFGFSAKPKNYAYSIMDQADLITSFLKHKNISSIKIISHDYGDTVAQELIARYIERKQKKQNGLIIESLCLLNGGIFPESHQPILIQKLLMTPLGSLIAQLFTRKKLGRNFKKIFGLHTQPSEMELDEFWKVITYNEGRDIVHLIIRYMKERVKYRTRWAGALQNCPIPLCMINGTYDLISGANIVKRFKELIPNPDVIELENIGHFPLIEAPEAVLFHYYSFDRKNQNSIHESTE